MKIVLHILVFLLLISGHIHLFGHNFGVSEGIKNAMLLVSAILTVAVLIVGKNLAKQKKKKKNTKRITVINFTIIWVIGLSGPFWMPFTGSSNGYLLDLLAGIVTGIVGSLIIFLVKKDQQKQMKANKSLE